MHSIDETARTDQALAIVVGVGGMGMAAARRLGQRYRLLLVDIDAARLDQSGQILREEGHDVCALRCDISSSDALAALSDKVGELGGFRALAHVAGLSPNMADFATILRVNLTGAALVAQTLLPHAHSGTAAIFISSLAAHGPRPSETIETILGQPTDPRLAEKLLAELGAERAVPGVAYQLSKYGLMQHCKRQARAWGINGARIVTLSPGMIATPMGALEFEKSPVKRQMFAHSPLQRQGSMLEIADAIEFLASDKASFISGTDLLVDGGLSASLQQVATRQ